MFPTINGKSLLECNEADLQVLLENPDYREYDYIDYKATFAFLEVSKNDPNRKALLAEFRSDVCSFANAEGGYLIYGIKDHRGMASEIAGVDIPGNNTDKFELERKNNLVPIMPKLPTVKFHFIPLENGKYVVILAVMHDNYAPYIHLEDESDYRIYRRIGNGKRTLSYMELKNMFIQSRSLENDILSYRKDRVDYFCENNDSVGGKNLQFLLLHIIPETFTDSFYNKNVFQLARSGKVNFAPMFSPMGCGSYSSPNVDGLRYGHRRSVAECSAKNNGIIECFLPLDNYIDTSAQQNCEDLAYESLWDSIKGVIEYYVDKIFSMADASRFFACITICGCKGVVTEFRSTRYFGDNGAIDRNKLFCTPVVFHKTEADTIVDRFASLKVEYLLSIGVKHSPELTQFANSANT